MKRPFKVLIAAVFALVVGSTIGYFTVEPVLNMLTDMSGVQNGAWGTNLAAGSTTANPYVRAWVAEHGLLALSQSETLYFHAYFDDNGERLLGNCDYRIEGKAPDARWWSITVYAEDDFLIPNDQRRYSWSSSELTLDPDGRFIIYLSKTLKEGNWLPTGEAEGLSLSLRLYNPGSIYCDKENLKTVDLPHIIKEGCQ
jgi:hypothetical protein